MYLAISSKVQALLMFTTSKVIQLNPLGDAGLELYVQVLGFFVVCFFQILRQGLIMYPKMALNL